MPCAVGSRPSRAGSRPRLVAPLTAVSIHTDLILLLGIGTHVLGSLAADDTHGDHNCHVEPHGTQHKQETQHADKGVEDGVRVVVALGWGPLDLEVLWGVDPGAVDDEEEADLTSDDPGDEEDDERGVARLPELHVAKELCELVSVGLEALLTGKKMSQQSMSAWTMTPTRV